MKDIEINTAIRQGIKSPSADFTNNLMGKINKIEEVEKIQDWKLKLLLAACFLIAVLSLFVQIPEIQYLNYTIRFSPVATPILSIIFLFVVFHQLYDLRNKLTELDRDNMIKHTI